jgi:Sulfotransferase domain
MARRLRLDRNDPTGKRRLVFVDSRHTRIHDVICGGMYRACSTWQYEVVGHLIERHLRGERLGYLTGEAYAARFAPFSRREVHADVGRRSWRVLKSHEGHRCFARALSSGQALAVYAYRDIRDVVFSLMHKRGLAFEELLRQGTIHQILVNDRFWRAQRRVLVQRYEELVADPVTAVVQLARHLGLGVTRREAAEIADDFSLESNQTRIEALRRRLENAGIDLTAPGNLQICDPVTLLHWNHLRPGGTGSWQTDSRLSQRVLLDRLCGTWLRANGYTSEPEAAALAEKAGYTSGVGLRDDLALAVGRLASLLRRVAGHCPRTATRVRQLLGVADSDPEPVFPWTLDGTPADWDLLHATRVRAGNEPAILAPRPVS